MVSVLFDYSQLTRMLIGQYIDRKWRGLTVENYLKILDCHGLVFRSENECVFNLYYEKQTQNMCQKWSGGI